jgi:molybdopterin converting factor small subunit
MSNKIQLIVIKWDQKQGGVQEAAYPPIKIQSKDAMNIYNLHRTTSILPSFASVRINLENGQQYNVCSFFSGFGGTSPDGFTGNYGKDKIGISEKVIGLFLPMDFKSSAYWEILMKVAARILISAIDIPKRLEKIVKCIEKSGLFEKPKELGEYLDEKLDLELTINPADQKKVFEFESKGLHYLISDLQDQIKDLTINPAATAYKDNKQRISQAQEEQQSIKDLLGQITQLSTQKTIIESVDSEKDELIETMKADYIKIFGTLTDQIVQLEEELKNISESTQSLVDDLNQALAEKIARVQELEEQIKTLNAA